MASYSSVEKLLHRIYLSNYFLSNSSLEIEKIINGSKAKKISVEQIVFVTGLARSGTTSVLRMIHATGQYASLQYSNMPFLFLPNIWSNKKDCEPIERPHNDRIFVSQNSPEEFDEYFWKATLADNYIKKEGLGKHEISDKILQSYYEYIQLICLSKNTTKYISKNNNNILRFISLKKLKNVKIVFLFREPLQHAASLLKLHKKFSDDQQRDKFVLDYFNYLGHHEFGLNHKPFLLTEEFNNKRNLYPKEEINYWLLIWLNYYSYLLDNFSSDCLLISFEDLIRSEKNVFNKLNNYLGLKSDLSKPNTHSPTKYNVEKYDSNLYKQAYKVYEKLNILKF